MIIRQTLNFAVHMLAGVAFGALAVAAASACCANRRPLQGHGHFEKDESPVPEAPPQAT